MTCRLILNMCFFVQVVISECSGAVGKFREKSLSINPQKTHMFKFGIHSYGMKGGNNYCVGEEYGQYSIYFLYTKAISSTTLMTGVSPTWHTGGDNLSFCRQCHSWKIGAALSLDGVALLLAI